MKTKELANALRTLPARIAFKQRRISKVEEKYQKDMKQLQEDIQALQEYHKELLALKGGK